MLYNYLLVYQQLKFFTFSNQTGSTNAKRFLLKPEVHYKQVHNVDDIKQVKRMKSSVSITNFFTKSQRNPQHSATATTSTTSVTKPTPNIKSGSTNPKRNKPLPSVSGYMDPTLNINSQLTNRLEKWAVGNIYNMVHQGANKCISNVTVLEYYDTSISMVREYFNILKNYTELSKAPEMKNIHPSPRVRLNNHNIMDVQFFLRSVKLNKCHYHPR